jgi:hypothetical protein
MMKAIATWFAGIITFAALCIGLATMQAITGFKFWHLGAFLGTTAQISTAWLFIWISVCVTRLLRHGTFRTPDRRVWRRITAAADRFEKEHEGFTHRKREVMRAIRREILKFEGEIRDGRLEPYDLVTRYAAAESSKSTYFEPTPEDRTVGIRQRLPLSIHDKWLIAAACWCMVLVLVELPNEWSYQLSRWALFLIAAGTGTLRWKNGVRTGTIPLVVLAVIFNPIAPISFKEDEWRVVDCIAAGVFMLHVARGREWLLARKQRIIAITLLPLLVVGTVNGWNHYVLHCERQWMLREARERQAETMAKQKADLILNDLAQKEEEARKAYQEWKRRNGKDISESEPKLFEDFGAARSDPDLPDNPDTNDAEYLKKMRDAEEDH